MRKQIGVAPGSAWQTVQINRNYAAIGVVVIEVTGYWGNRVDERKRSWFV